MTPTEIQVHDTYRNLTRQLRDDGRTAKAPKARNSNFHMSLNIGTVEGDADGVRAESVIYNLPRLINRLSKRNQVWLRFAGVVTRWGSSTCPPHRAKSSLEGVLSLKQKNESKANHQTPFFELCVLHKQMNRTQTTE